MTIEIPHFVVVEDHVPVKCGHCYGEGVCLRLDMKPGSCDQCKGTGYIKLKDNSNANT